MTQETENMIVLLQLEFSAEIEQADRDPEYSYRIFQRKTGNPIYQACRFRDMCRFFDIGPSMKIEDIDIRIQWGREIVVPAMIDTPRMRERPRLKLVRFNIVTGYGPEGTKGMFATHLHLGIYLYPDGEETSYNPYWILRLAGEKKLSCSF